MCVISPNIITLSDVIKVDKMYDLLRLQIQRILDCYFTDEKLMKA